MFMKILLFDIENSPSKAYIWQSKTIFVPNNMIFAEWYMLCWAAKWLGEKKVISSALCDNPSYKKDLTNDYYIVKKLWNLLDEADVVVAHNAANFDVKKANARFVYHGMPPPSPYKIVDTLILAKSKFKFTSNKLDYLGKNLNLGKKKENAGMILWERCMAGDIKSWKEMVAYCRQDVVLLEKLYKRFLPYMDTHPNTNIYNGTINKCPKCGGSDIQKRGYVYVLGGRKQRFQCVGCGGWCSEGKVVKNA
jgi:DNA polymerase elongation subunit (family B)